MAEHCVILIYPYFPNGYGPSNLLSHRLAALQVAVSDITLTVAPGYGASEKLLTVQMLGLHGRLCQRNREVNELDGRLRKQDAYVKNLQRQLQQIAVQLREVKSASRSRHQRLQSNATEHQDIMHEYFEQTATQ